MDFFTALLIPEMVVTAICTGYLLGLFSRIPLWLIGEVGAISNELGIDAKHIARYRVRLLRRVKAG